MNGDLLWSATYGGTDDDVCEDATVTTSGLVMVGDTRSFEVGNGDIWAIKLSFGGDSLWSTRLGGYYNEGCKSVARCNDGGLMLAGRTSTFPEPIGQRGWLVKLSSEGDSLWSTLIGSLNGTTSLYDCVVLPNGNIAACGYTVTPPNSGQYLFVLVDSLGNPIVVRSYGGTGEAGGDVAYSIAASVNGTFFIAGNRYSIDGAPWLLALNELGDSLWSWVGQSNNDVLRSVLALGDNSVVVTGGNGLTTRISSGGNELWTTYYGLDPMGESLYDVCLVDRQFVIVGDLNVRDSDILLTKTATDSTLRYLSVLDPQNSARTTVFDTLLLEWDSPGIDGEVGIELNRHYPIGPWEVITSSTENDGEYEWFVTDPLSDSCRIRICAVQDTFCDISDGNFSIVSSQGYLALVKSNTQNTPVLSWNAGTLECPSPRQEYFRLKNFGSEAVVVFQPLEPASAEFSRATTCGSFFALAPGGISTCSLTVGFAPTGEGLIHDTLRIQTDAINGIGGFVSIPLSGNQIRTPESPEVVISTVGNNAVLTWSPIVESIGHCQIDPPSYLVFFSEDPDGPFWFHGGTNDTTYTHVWAIQYASAMFYHVVAVEAAPGLLEMLPRWEDGGRITLEQFQYSAKDAYNKSELLVRRP